MHSSRALRFGVLTATCGLALASLTGCGVKPAQQSAVPTTPETTATQAPPTTVTPSATAATAGHAPITGSNPITMAFVGDMHFEGRLQPVAKDPQGLAAMAPLINKAHITVGNVETAIATGGTPQPNKPFTFRAPPSVLTTLANAGFDVVSLANNHGADYNTAGVAESVAAAQNSPVTIIGFGKNASEALAPSVHTIDGVTIAVLSATQLSEETTIYHTATDTKAGVASMVNPTKFVAAVKDAASKYDVVVTFLHYGTEGETCPTPNQFKAQKLLAEAGADIIVGGHSHRVQAGGWSGNTYVNYGLGSAVWWRQSTAGVLTIDIDKARVNAKRNLPADKKTTAPTVVTKESWVATTTNNSGVAIAMPATGQKAQSDLRASLMSCSKLRAQP